MPRLVGETTGWAGEAALKKLSLRASSQAGDLTAGDGTGVLLPERQTPVYWMGAAEENWVRLGRLAGTGP